MCLGGRKIGAAAAARRQYHDMGAKQMQAAVLKPPCDDAAARAVIDDQIKHEIFDEELGIVLQALLVKRVKHSVPGPVSGGTGALGQALAPVHGVPAKRPLIDPAILGARERHAEMLELDNCGRRVAAHEFDGILVAKPVRSLDRVVHVPAPVVLAHVAESSADAALRRYGMTTGGKDLADTRRLQACGSHAEGGAQ